jgi:YHS domain-containing protein
LNTLRKNVRHLAPLVLAILVTATPVLALSPVNKSLFGSVAIEGFDPVAYFTDGKPVEGKKEFQTTWNGATWRFASAEHRDLFVKDPTKYAPQYGGYCAWAVAQNDTAGIDPKAWTIVDGRLYLNYSLEIQKKWTADIPGNVKKGDANWPHLLGR